MRRKILQSMGLDDESLAKMSTTEHQAIEKAIADAIEDKLNGATLANKQNNDDETPSEQRDRMQADCLQPEYVRCFHSPSVRTFGWHGPADHIR